ncbi:hypothetical protein [Actinomycetospora sp. NBRC 106378]|uniref:hypothetical protein n=1 Tax=Actinomycetospora sp. NBRC 106378 TaxID=3032208 RepID=UPI0024A517D5|nr:hypothetical protein [Actinomycetospora sp. NBRC 106378]GLZ53045.1 hypothetical protein Acsp07_26620 [Actinomycetospora sp. NBRC 106378]
MTDGRQPLSSRPRGSARPRSAVGDDELRVAWTRWLGVLRVRGWDPVPVLRPGAAPSAIAAAEQTVGRALPDPVRALYASTDGQADPAEVGGPVLFPARRFCSLDAAVELWRAREGEDRWPLAAGAAGGLLLLDEQGRVVGSGSGVLADGIVDYLGLLSVAELEGPGSDRDGAVVWDAPGLR